MLCPCYLVLVAEIKFLNSNPGFGLAASKDATVGYEDAEAVRRLRRAQGPALWPWPWPIKPPPSDNKTSPLFHIGTILGVFSIGGLGGFSIGGGD